MSEEIVESPGLSATLSVEMKVNLGQYESASCFISVQGITPDMDEADIESLLDGPVKIAYDTMKARLMKKIRGLEKARAEQKERYN